MKSRRNTGSRCTDAQKLMHDEACARGEETYIDPDTGYIVFTKLKHLARGYCCDSGCRHCPYREGADGSSEAREETVPQSEDKSGTSS